MTQEYKDLLKLVYDTRKAQNYYFRTKTHLALSEAKRLEQKLDALVEKQYTPPTPPTQKTLL